MDTSETCPGCGGSFDVSDGPTHRYLGASPGCWAVYGEVLAKEYSDAAYYRVHRLTVDAYSAQHPVQRNILAGVQPRQSSRWPFI